MTTSEPPIRRKGVCCELELPADGAWAGERAALLKAVADPTRLVMLWTLRRAQAPVCICDYTASLDLGQPTISHHMSKLKAAGLVESEKRGVWTYYRLREDLAPWVTAVLDALMGEAPAVEPAPSCCGAGP